MSLEREKKLSVSFASNMQYKIQSKSLISLHAFKKKKPITVNIDKRGRGVYARSSKHDSVFIYGF